MNSLEQQREDQALGAAWRRCETALPDGWGWTVLQGYTVSWIARAYEFGRGTRERHAEIEGTGATVTEALTGLADRLEAL